MKLYLREANGGTQEVHRFDNNYGASIIRGGGYAYGGLELAVVKFYGTGDDEWSLDYDTIITDDVLGHLSEDDVVNLLSGIEGLNSEGC